MTLLERMTARPFHFSFVTEELYLIALYPVESVFIWDNDAERWRNPSWQTYGADIAWMTRLLMGNTTTIPYRVLGGEERCNKFIADLKAKYSKLK